MGFGATPQGFNVHAFVVSKHNYMSWEELDLLIGIPKEIMQNERRVSATPETVALMVKDGLTVQVERSAGEGSYYSDDQYIEAGAQIVDDVADIFAKADVIMKVKEPQFNAAKKCSEVEMMREGQYLMTFIHPAAPDNHEMVKALAAKGVISLTLDGVPRITRAQKMDALTSMSTCAGYKGMLMAMDSLTMFTPQVFTAVGMLKPINVLIIGAGVAGLQAIATAKRMGAVVHTADIRPEAEEQGKSVGAAVVKTGVPEDVAVGEGGYAKPVSEEWLAKEREAIKDIVSKCEIVVCTALIPNRKAPILVTEEMLKSMKPGSVVVDISIDQGGNCALTEPGEIVTKHDVIINGIKNLPGRIPTTATWMFSKNIYEMLKYVLKDGKIVLDQNDEVIQGVLTTYGGKVVHEGALEAMS